VDAIGAIDLAGDDEHLERSGLAAGGAVPVDPGAYAQ
jgi:hypothetical protein